MRREVEAVRDLSRTLVDREALIELLAEIEMIRLEAMVRLCSPSPQAQPDSLLDVEQAAQRLRISTDWLYRHAKELPFRVAIKGSTAIRFSSNGIDRYLQRATK